MNWSRYFGFVVGLSLVSITSWRPLSADEQVASPQDESPNDDDGEKYEEVELQADVAEFLAAKTSREAGESRRKLFSTPFDASVEDLMSHENPHVAVQAAWMRYSRMVRRRGLSFGKSNETLDPRDVERFLGFLEGKGRVVVPDWWERALADSDDNLRYEENPTRRGWTEISKVLIAKDEDEVVLDLWEKQVRIPAKTYAWLTNDSSTDFFCVHTDEHRAALLEYNEIAGTARLVCVDLDEPKELWRNVSWGTGGDEVPVRSGPPSFHRATLQVNEHSVALFGAMTNGYGMYVESYSIQDGTPIFRFATNNWMIKPDENRE